MAAAVKGKMQLFSLVRGGGGGYAFSRAA